MDVPSLGVRSELQLPAYTTATATWDPSLVCKLHHTSQQRQIPDPLSGARDQTCLLMDTSRIHFCCATEGTPHFVSLMYVCREKGSTPQLIAGMCFESFIDYVGLRGVFFGFFLVFFFFKGYTHVIWRFPG